GTDRARRAGGEGGADRLLALYEPGGLSAAGERLFVADTNSHRVVAVDLNSGGHWIEVMIAGLDRPRNEEREFAGRLIRAPFVPPKYGMPIEGTLAPHLPAGARLDMDGPLYIRATSADGSVIAQESRMNAALPAVFTIPAGKEADRGPWTV